MWAHNSGLSAKAPSVILIGSQKDVVAFGYEAQIKYASLVENSMSSDYYYFEKFKLVLYNNKVCISYTQCSKCRSCQIARAHA